MRAIFRIIIYLIIIVGLAGWRISGSILYARIAFFGISLVVISFFWMFFSLKGIQISRKTRILKANVGDIFEEHFEVRNNSWLPISWLEISNESDLPAASGSRLLTNIASRQRRFYTSRTLLTRRGAFSLGPTILKSGDPFGLFSRTRLVPSQSKVVVLPYIVPIKEFPYPPGILPGGRTIQQRTLDVTPHAAGVRDYVPGDSMKRIHWPSTAHRGRIMVKEFEQDPQAEIWLFLDAQNEVQFSFPDTTPDVNFEEKWWFRRSTINLPKDSFEYVISITASLCKYFLDCNRSLGIASAAGKGIIVQAERGIRQLNKIMETLAFLRPDGKLSINGLVQLQVKRLPIGSSALLITPSIGKDLILASEECLMRKIKPFVIMIEKNEFTGEEHQLNILASLEKRNIPFIQVKVEDNLAEKLAFISRLSIKSWQPQRAPFLPSQHM